MIPKSVTTSRIIENFAITELAQEDFKALEQVIGGEERRMVDPRNFWNVDVFGLL